MRVAVVGSRTLSIPNLEDYLPKETSEIVSGGARGVDSSARAYALAHGIPLREFLPEYEKYGRAAPLRRNAQIVQSADYALIFWDGQSRGTRHTLDLCAEYAIPFRLIDFSAPDKDSQANE